MATKQKLFDAGLAVFLIFSVFGCATPRDNDNLEVDLAALLEEDARQQSAQQPEILQDESGGQNVEAEFRIDGGSTPDLSDADSEAFLLGPAAEGGDGNGDNKASLQPDAATYQEEENPFDDQGKEIEEENLSAIFFDDRPLTKSPQDLLAEHTMLAAVSPEDLAPELPDMQDSMNSDNETVTSGRTMLASVTVPDAKTAAIQIVQPVRIQQRESQERNGATQMASVPDALGKIAGVSASELWRLKQTDPSRVLYSGKDLASGKKAPRMVKVLIDGRPATILSA